jgi:hypothetical protein
MKDKQNKNLHRKKPKRRVRGAPIFFKPNIEVENEKELIMPPETSSDIARLLKDEIKKRWPDAVGLPETISGKHVKILKGVVEEFQGETVREMVRILVWDFDEIQKNKGFFPPSSHLKWPWLDQLYNYRHALASAVGEGITDSASRVSAYKQRYHSDNEVPTSTPSNKPETSKDIAKRILGQG